MYIKIHTIRMHVHTYTFIYISFIYMYVQSKLGTRLFALILVSDTMQIVLSLTSHSETLALMVCDICTSSFLHAFLRSTIRAH